MEVVIHNPELVAAFLGSGWKRFKSTKTFYWPHELPRA